MNSVNLQSILNGVNSKFSDDNGKYVYNGFITSKYLDDNVNRERTAFNTSEEDGTLTGGVTKKDIVEKATAIITKYLSDDIDHTSHDLWLIDEKLSYHYYLASDKKIKSMKPVESNSSEEPDIMIFDSPFAFTDESTQPFRNITIRYSSRLWMMNIVYHTARNDKTALHLFYCLYHIR